MNCADYEFCELPHRYNCPYPQTWKKSGIWGCGFITLIELLNTSAEIAVNNSIKAWKKIRGEEK